MGVDRGVDRGVGPWSVPGGDAGETVGFPPGNRRSADEDFWDRGASQLERPWENPWDRERDTVGTGMWSNSGNRTEAEGLENTERRLRENTRK